MLLGRIKTGKTIAVKTACKICGLELIEANLICPPFYGSDTQRALVEVELADAHILPAAEKIKLQKLKNYWKRVVRQLLHLLQSRK